MELVGQILLEPHNVCTVWRYNGQFLLHPLNIGTLEMSGQFCFRRFNPGNEPLRKVELTPEFLWKG